MLRLLGEILEKGRWLCCGLALFQVKVFSFLAVDGIYAVGVLLGDSSALALGTHRVLTCIISGLCLDDVIYDVFLSATGFQADIQLFSNIFQFGDTL